MALDGSTAAEGPDRQRPLQAVFSTAMAGVAEVAGRLGLVDAGVRESHGNRPDDPHRETWVAIHRDVAEGAEAAAFAAGLHHCAAAHIEAAESELRAIAKLVHSQHLA